MKDFTRVASMFVGASAQAVNAKTGVILTGLLSLSDKEGTMKDGEKAPYVVLLAPEATVSLHPEHAKRLFMKGEDSGVKLILQGLSTSAPSAFELLPQSTEQVAAVNQADEAINAAPAKKAPQAGSLKARFIEMFARMHAAGAKRSEVKAAAVAELKMSDACFNTYYQNCKSGDWA